MMATTGPVTLGPGESESFSFAVVLAQGTDRLDSVAKLRAKAYTARQLGTRDAFALAPLQALPVSAPPPPLAVSLPAPNPFSASTRLTFEGLPPDGSFPLRVTVYDVLGRRAQGPVAVSRSGEVELGRDLAPGVYAVRVTGVNVDETVRVTKIR